MTGDPVPRLVPRRDPDEGRRDYGGKTRNEEAFASSDALGFLLIYTALVVALVVGLLWWLL